jgi:hypothetical protein
MSCYSKVPRRIGMKNELMKRLGHEKSPLSRYQKSSFLSVGSLARNTVRAWRRGYYNIWIWKGHPRHFVREPPSFTWTRTCTRTLPSTNARVLSATVRRRRKRKVACAKRTLRKWGCAQVVRQQGVVDGVVHGVWIAIRRCGRLQGSIGACGGLWGSRRSGVCEHTQKLLCRRWSARHLHTVEEGVHQKTILFIW